MKRIPIFSILLIIILFLCSCDPAIPEVVGNEENLNRFEVYEQVRDANSSDTIYVDKQTGCLYFVHYVHGVNGNSLEWCTPLLGSDGLPLLAEGYERTTN